MTVSTTQSRIEYTGNGVTTVFSFPYKFLADGDLVVVIIDNAGVVTVQTISSNYTVSGAGDDAGGSVTMLTPPASTDTLLIYRDTVIDQEVDYISGESFPAETHEGALDRITVIAQELDDALTRTASLSRYYTGSGTADLPDPEDGSYLRWRSDLQGFENAGAPSVVSYENNYSSLSDAVAATDLAQGDVVNVKERVAGQGGTSTWDTVLSSTVTENAANVVQCTGVPTLSMVLRSNGPTKVTGPVYIRQWGARDSSFNNTTVFQTAVDYLDSVNSGGNIILDSGTYDFTGLTLKPSVSFRGENPNTTILQYTPATGDCLTGGADLNKVRIENLRIKSNNSSSGWGLLLDTATVRQLEISNVVFEGFLKAFKVSDGLDCKISHLYMSGRGKTTSGGIGLQLGHNTGQRGTTWQVDSVYSTLFEKGVIAWATTSSFNKIIVENSTTSITTYSSGNWTNIYSEANTDFWNINDNGIYIKNFREQAVSGNDFTFSDAETERRTTIVPGTADTNPAASGKNYTFKFGMFRLYRNGKALFHSDGSADYLSNMPTQAGMVGAINIHSESTAEADLMVAVTRKIDAGIGKNIYIQAGGAKAGETDTDGGSAYIDGGIATGNGRSDIRFRVCGGGASGTADRAPTERYVMDTNGHLRPITTAVQDLGSASTEFRDIYLVNAPTVSSDIRLKEQIADLEEAERATALQIKKGLKKYKLKSAVEKKGEKARIHMGVIAQEVKQAFLDNGLNPHDYALFCETQWATLEEEYIDTEKKVTYETGTRKVDGKEVLDDKGKPIPELVEKVHYVEVTKKRERLITYAEKPYPKNAVVHTQMSIRYEELLCFIIASI